MLALNVNGMKNDLHAPRTPPFSWEPDQVEVLDSGDLALTTGPVHGPDVCR